MSDKYARIEVDSLYYTAQGFMDTTSGVRRGESVMESLGSLRSSLTFVGRLRRTTHLALGKVFRAVTYPLPKPMQSRLRKAAWVPIRTAYAVLKKYAPVCIDRDEWQVDSAEKVGKSPV